MQWLKNNMFSMQARKAVENENMTFSLTAELLGELGSKCLWEIITEK